ncbi:MAG: hypothetical protein AB7K71_07480 [Polyangiaceae bacterium]
MAAPSLIRLRSLLFPCAIGLGLTLAHPAQAARKICVDVVQKSWDPAQPHGTPKSDDKQATDPPESTDKATPAPEAPAAATPEAPAKPDAPTKDPAETSPADPEPLPGPRMDQTVPESPWSKEPGLKPAAKPNEAEDLPEVSSFDAPAYLRRMLEYEVTHDPNYEAVQKGCGQRITVELYPLKDGWTVFARYSGYAREEKVDYVTADEFAQLAQRLARALLYDRPISDTITRENVLRADSEQRLRTIGVRGHALFGMGTALRIGKLPTATDDGTQANDELRLLTPITLALGYRGKLKAWGLDALGRVNLGTRERAASYNLGGGHADYSGGVGLALHFFRYLDPPGVTSVYVGGGASFDLAIFSLIRPEEDRASDSRDSVVGGGLNLDLVLGYEFLRASSLHFFTQVELNVPTYVIHAENDSGAVDSYLPGAIAQVGVIF